MYIQNIMGYHRSPICQFCIVEQMHIYKSFTRSCVLRFDMKLRHSVSAVSGAPLSNS